MLSGGPNDPAGEFPYHGAGLNPAPWSTIASMRRYLLSTLAVVAYPWLSVAVVFGGVLYAVFRRL
jgi:hypothetical protein